MKVNEDTKVEDFRARLCCNGAMQRKGIDYHESFSPTGDIAALKVCYAIAAERNMIERAGDVSHAFISMFQ